MRPNAGIATYSGIAGIATYATSAGIATYATNSGIATYATNSGIATYASTSGVSTVSQGLTGTPNLNVGIVTATEYYGVFKGTLDSGVILDKANYSNFSGIATYASTAGIATYATSAGIATYATSAGIATYATSAGISTIATNVIGGIASVTSLSVTGITTLGSVEISSGIVTAKTGIVTYYGDGSQLTGVVAGASVVSISTNTTNQSQFIPYATSTGSVAGLGVTTSRLVFNPSTTRLGIGTTNARANLDVTDSILISTGVAQTAGFLIKSYTNSNGAISFEDVDNTNPRFSIDRDTSYLFKVNDSSFATRLIVDNSGNLGIGTTTPASKLTVVGDVLVSGILTANRLFSGLYGEFVGGSISGTAIVGTSLSITGISTFTNGPVFIGSGTSTGTASQRLQVTGGAYVSGNLGIGTTNARANLDVIGNTLVSGNLGIGTNNARANLDVTDSILISTGVAQTAGFLIKSYTNSNGAISFEDVDNTNPRFSIDRDTSYLFKVNDSSFATRLIVNNSGNLGV